MAAIKGLACSKWGRVTVKTPSTNHETDIVCPFPEKDYASARGQFVQARTGKCRSLGSDGRGPRTAQRAQSVSLMLYTSHNSLCRTYWEMAVRALAVWSPCVLGAGTAEFGHDASLSHRRARSRAICRAFIYKLHKMGFNPAAAIRMMYRSATCATSYCQSKLDYQFEHALVHSVTFIAFIKCAACSQCRASAGFRTVSVAVVSVTNAPE